MLMTALNLKSHKCHEHATMNTCYAPPELPTASERSSIAAETIKGAVTGFVEVLGTLRTTVEDAHSEAGRGLGEFALHLLRQLPSGRQDDAAGGTAAGLCRRP